jgi:N-acetylglucosamine-6-phosphate deacetylase
VRPILLENGVLLDPEARAPANGSLLLEGERIRASLRPGAPAPRDALRLDLAGAALAPGFVDLHFHGELAFPEAGRVEDALERASRLLARHGTTAFLATTVTQTARSLGQLVTQLAECMTQTPFSGAAPLGIHLEGPWISPRAAGAQPAEGIRPAEAAEVRDLLARGAGWLRMVTCAPEAPGVEALIPELARRDVVVALGHSAASAEQASAAVAHGARHVTHLFNAMSPLHHRAPGLVGVALVDDRLTCDLICDGVHVHPAALRLAARAKAERLVLISDRIDLPAEGAAGFGSGPLHEDGAVLRLADGRLAGSRLTLDRGVANARALAGLELLQAVAAATVRPARLLGIEGERGTLRPGARADLVVLEPDGSVRETWIGGRRVHPA